MARTPFQTPSSVGVGVWAFAGGNSSRRKTLDKTKNMKAVRFLVIGHFSLSEAFIRKIRHLTLAVQSALVLLQEKLSI
jgi:hypothetical protein